MRDQPDPINHLRKESRGITTPREAKHVDVVSGRVVLHEEFVSTDDMVGERGADSAILGLRIPVLQLFPRSPRAELGRGNVRSDPGLVVVETVPLRPVKHAKDLEDVTIAGVPVELIAFSSG